MSKKYEKVMKYLIDNPTAKASVVAKACKCSVKYVYNLKSKVGTPKEKLKTNNGRHWSIELVYC